MDRSDIVRAFLTAGHQLGADALRFFEANPEKVKEFLNLSAGRQEKSTVTMETVNNTLSGISPRVRVLKSFSAKQRQTSVDEVSNQLARRYQRTMEILEKKPELVNLISINRVSQQTKRFSMIAMVKEISRGDRSLVVEDPTGTTSVYIGDEAVGDFSYLLEDEVIGVVCDNEESSENRAVKIVFPDIPLSTKIAVSGEDVLCMFVSDIHMDDPGFMQHSLEKLSDYAKKIKQEAIVFVLGDVSKDDDKVKKFAEIFPENFSIMFLRGELETGRDNFLPDPVVVEVCGVRMFLSHGGMFAKYFEKFKTSPEMMMLQMIKKRHISPTFRNNAGLDDEKLFIEQPADIFAIGHFHEPRTINYKGVTIFSLGSFVTQPIFWAVNLKTRESIKIDLT